MPGLTTPSRLVPGSCELHRWYLGPSADVETYALLLRKGYFGACETEPLVFFGLLNIVGRGVSHQVALQVALNISYRRVLQRNRGGDSRVWITLKLYTDS